MHLPPIALIVLHRTRLTWQLAAKWSSGGERAMALGWAAPPGQGHRQRQALFGSQPELWDRWPKNKRNLFWEGDTGEPCNSWEGRTISIWHREPVRSGAWSWRRPRSALWTYFTQQPQQCRHHRCCVMTLSILKWFKNVRDIILVTHRIASNYDALVLEENYYAIPYVESAGLVSELSGAILTQV